MSARRSRTGDCETEAGFALVESICALVVGSLIVVALSLSVGIVLKASAAIARRTNETEVLASGLAALGRDLSGALALTAEAKPSAPVLFEGSPGALGFARAGEVVWIETVAAKGGGLLRRSARPAAPGLLGLGAPDEARAVPLVAGPWRFRFSYAALDGPPGGEAGAPTGAPAAAKNRARPGEWTADWSGRDRLPDLVRLDVLGAEGAGRPLLSLAIPTRGRRARLCAFDDPAACRAPAAVAEAAP